MNDLAVIPTQEKEVLKTIEGLFKIALKGLYNIKSFNINHPNELDGWRYYYSVSIGRKEGRHYVPYNIYFTFSTITEKEEVSISSTLIEKERTFLKELIKEVNPNFTPNYED